LTDTPTSQYLHADHAGNFADLYKHARLIALLRALGAEAGPRVYLESHAGAGSYDLDPASRAWRSGFGRLAERDELPAPVAELRAHVTRTGGHWRYPGSPRLAAALLASRDRLCLVERDPETHARLRAEFAAGASAGRPTVSGPWRRGRDRGTARHLPCALVRRHPRGMVSAACGWL
jgi:23S rRNA (adenine2030-N6)-methyltransferase